MADLLLLKNGTDIRGTATEGVDGDPVTLTDGAVLSIAAAFTVWAEKRLGKKPTVAVGHDPRLSSERLVSLTVRGVFSQGGKAVLTGLSSTPSMFKLLLDPAFGADVSVMVTASHLPYQKNGLKFFTREGALESAELDEVLHIAESVQVPAQTGAEKPEYRPYLERYAAGLVGMVRKATGEERPLAGKRIVVDAGNGAGGFYERLVLRPLGADTAGSQFTQPDGRFPHHIPNPEDAEAMRSVSEAVKRSHADFGVIFDTDVDRAGAVSSTGEEINRNRLIALISAILLEERKGAYIVTDSVTSDGLSQFIASRGGVHRRFRRGYKNVINECKRLNAEGKYSPLAIETSGHAAFPENDYLDDGAYLVTRLLIALSKAAKEGKDLMDLISGLPEPAEAREVRLHFPPQTDYKALGARILKDLKQAAERLPYLSLPPENHEGVRIAFDRGHGDGWALVRMSLHEPIMPVNAESDSQGGVALILQELYALMQGYGFPDIGKLLQNG